MSEEDSSSLSVHVLDEKKFNIKTDKDKEMELFLRIYNNDDFGISIYTINECPSKKYELKCNLDQIQRNRFFKIFLNTEEIIKELETKIENSIFIEEDNHIHMEITIGLTVINQIELEIKETEKTKEEIENELSKRIEEQKKLIENLEKEINQLKNNNNELNNNMNQLRNNNNNLNDQKNKKDEKIKKLKEEIEKLKLNNEQINNKEINEKNKKIENLEKEITQLKKKYNDLNKEKNIKNYEMENPMKEIKKEEENPEPKGKSNLCIIKIYK